MKKQQEVAGSKAEGLKELDVIAPKTTNDSVNYIKSKEGNAKMLDSMNKSG